MQDSRYVADRLTVASERVNLSSPALVRAAIDTGEGESGAGGSLLVRTGTHTGRSPKDKFIVRSADAVASVCWDSNQPMQPENFDRLLEDMLGYAQQIPIYRQDLQACRDPDYALKVRIYGERAWHALFLTNLLSPSDTPNSRPDFTIINCPGFRADVERHGCRSETVIALNFEHRLVLIGGTGYGGENKKSVFTLLNHILPEADVMPMHCSANHALGNPSDSALFFGLSGTGKTTLSSDPNRVLIGDDEHGWSRRGIFNFEGGCYAKTLNLDPVAEPAIHAATRTPGTILENVVRNAQTGEVDFFDSSLTENGRCAYGIEMVAGASLTGRGGHPKNLFMLTCDAFGVLPAIARLSPAQAEYHFLSGFTSKVAGTERGVNEPLPVFSACFGQPFLTRRATDYGRLLRRRIDEFGPACWLINTGWSGGGLGVGHRMPIASTRAVLAAVHDGKAHKAEFRIDPNFGFAVPAAIEGVDTQLLTPRAAWGDGQAFDATTTQLSSMFNKNFRRFEAGASSDTRLSMPRSG